MGLVAGVDIDAFIVDRMISGTLTRIKPFGPAGDMLQCRDRPAEVVPPARRHMVRFNGGRSVSSGCALTTVSTRTDGVRGVRRGQTKRGYFV